MNNKYYAVRVGRKIGIFYNWEDCKKQVNGYRGAIFKSFKDKGSAERFLNNDCKELKKELKNFEGINEPGNKNRKTNGLSLIAYVDGSYNIKTKTYGYGCVIISGQKVIKRMNGFGKDKEYVSMRNVAGEILGSLMAIEFAIDKGYESVYIYYDYEGIEKWANGEWKANKKGTIDYVNKIKKYKKYVNIGFMKVLAHSGDFYNDMADKLAKTACGL